jgi:hypothetical protein
MNPASPRVEQQAHWQQHIAAWQQSSLSQAAYCDAHDLVYHRFTYWRRKLTSGHTMVSQSRFVAVQRAADPGTGLTLTLPNGIRIQGLAPPHLAWLPQLLAQLS